MGIKIDINDTINKAVGVTTKFGAFWKGMTFPDNFGPALSYLLVLGLLPLIGGILMGIVPIPILGTWFSYGIVYGIVMGILGYVFFVCMPILMGVILGAIDPAMNINKAKAPAYATALAYVATPAAIGALLGWIPFLGWLIGLALWVLALIITYLAFTEGVGMDSGQAIIMMLIMAVITVIVYAVVFMVIVGMVFGSVLWGGVGFPRY